MSGQAVVALVAIGAVMVASLVSIVLGPGALGRMVATIAAQKAEGAGAPLPVFQGPSHLTLLAVHGAGEPFVAVVGSRGHPRPLAVDIPSHVVLTLPGSGTGTVADAASGELSLLLVSIENMLAAPVEHAVTLDTAGLARAVNAAGGIPVSLLERENLAGANVGPGTVKLSGGQVIAYLATAQSFDRGDHWRAVLKGFLGTGPTFRADDIVGADDLKAVNAALSVARGAQTRELPARESEGGLLLPLQGQIRGMLNARFGMQVPDPVPIIVMNGSGKPGVGAKVARRLVPGGFQVVGSENAPKFNYRTTTVYANSQAAFPAAERAGKLLGVGAVTLGQSPVSGLADITIVVGRDF
jgi:LytR cell envelope-related transcriptional attenuator/LytR_cpsA_psr family